MQRAGRRLGCPAALQRAARARGRTAADPAAAVRTSRVTALHAPRFGPLPPACTAEPCVVAPPHRTRARPAPRAAARPASSDRFDRTRPPAHPHAHHVRLAPPTAPRCAGSPRTDLPCCPCPPCVTSPRHPPPRRHGQPPNTGSMQDHRAARACVRRRASPHMAPHPPSSHLRVAASAASAAPKRCPHAASIKSFPSAPSPAARRRSSAENSCSMLGSSIIMRFEPTTAPGL